MSMSKYFVKTDVAYLAWSTEIEWSSSCEILMNVNWFVYLINFTWNPYPSVSTDSFNISSEVYQYTQSSTGDNTTNLDTSGAYF